MRTAVGFARIRLACESVRIANPHHRFNWADQIISAGRRYNIETRQGSVPNSRRSVRKDVTGPLWVHASYLRIFAFVFVFGSIYPSLTQLRIVIGPEGNAGG